MNTLMKTLLITAVAALAYPAIAAGPASAPRPMQREMSKAEHMKFAEERFAAMDANKDGKITAEERSAKHPGHGMNHGASMPAEVTKAQAMKFAEDRFTVLDTNKDGKIGREEHRAQRGTHHSMHHSGRMGSDPDARGMKHGKHGDFGLVPAAK